MASVRTIPLSSPWLDERETELVSEVLGSGRLSLGPTIDRFEEAFAEAVGAPYAAAVSSGTAGLHLLCIAAGVAPGDEVVTSPYSFVASANCALYEGATPVFADIERDTWNIDPQDACGRVSPRTKAVVPVHQVGLAADLDGLAPLRAKGMSIVEDAACGLGSTYKGRPIGSHGNLACFSFHPRKSISTGEGGMITTDDPEVAERARRLRSHGASVSALSRHEARGLVFEEYAELGFNYRMSDVQAAIGVAQLPKLDGLLARRRAIADRYDRTFRSLPEVQRPSRPGYAGHAFQSYGLVLTPACRHERDAVLRALIEAGISCRRGIPPIHLEPLYQDRYGVTSLPVTEEVASRALFLPMYASLTEADQDRVVDAVARILTS